MRSSCKYFDGEPVIREIERISKPGRRVYVAVRNLPRINNGLGVRHSVDAEGRHGRPRRARGECGRRNHLHGVLMSRIGKKAVAVPTGVTANVEGQTVKVKGRRAPCRSLLHDDVSVAMDKGAIKLEPRGGRKRARSMWGTSRDSGRQRDVRRDQRLRREAGDHRRRLIAPRCRARPCSCSSAFPTT